MHITNSILDLNRILDLPGLIRALEICGVQMSKADFEPPDDMGVPHSPPTALPKGKMAVYIFLHGKNA
ncbi:MAG: hypothetical protein OXR07_06165 [Nitrospira sp.]|nr:hypothetical protein [Nitrospira sp.]MDD9860145.1 hypothetical protein [Nitrospira sp.]